MIIFKIINCLTIHRAFFDFSYASFIIFCRDRRKFLLVSGLGHQLLGVILETGGCTANPKGTIGPDPFYVDQAVNTLEHLSEMGIPLVCEKWLTLPHNPSLLDIDNVISTSAKIKKFDLRTEIASTNPPSIVLKRTKSLEMSESSSTTSGGGSPSPGPRLRGDKPSDTNSSYEMSTAFRGDVSSRLIFTLRYLLVLT